MSSTRKLIGYIIALVGGGLGLLSFFAMPFFASGFLNTTAQQYASIIVQALQQNSQFTSNSGVALVLLWLAPVFAGLIGLIAIFQFRSSALVVGKKAADAWLIALGVLGVVLYIGLIIYVYTQLSTGTGNVFSLSYLGTGYWTYLIAMIGTIIGGALARSAKASITPPSPTSSFTQYAPPPVYPPDRQSSSPSYPPYGESQYPPPPPNQS